MGGPAGVADGRSRFRQRVGLDGGRQVRDLARFLAGVEFTTGNDGDASRVVAAVFESTKPVDDDLPPVAASEVSNDSTHVGKLYIKTARFLTLTFAPPINHHRRDFIDDWPGETPRGLGTVRGGSGSLGRWGHDPCLYASRMDFFNLYAQGFARVAAATLPVADFAPASNAERTIAAVRQAHDQGVAALVFPELSLSGYAIDDRSEEHTSELQSQY